MKSRSEAVKEQIMLRGRAFWSRIMSKRVVGFVVAILVGIFAGQGLSEVLVHFTFDGVLDANIPVELADSTGNVTFERYDGGGVVKYGPPNPYFNTGGTSADFTPTVGLFRLNGLRDDVLDLNIEEYTIEMFIRPDVMVQAALFRKHRDSYIVDIRRDNSVSWSHAGETEINNQLFSGSDTVLSDNWYHVACVFDSDAKAPMKFYLDGELVDSGGTAELNPDNMSPAAIGEIRRENQTHGQFYDGLIDELRVVDIALDPTEFLTRTPGLAMRPRPTDKELAVDLNVILNWRAGDFAVSHDVYFGTNFDDVNEADPGTGGGVYKGNQTATSYNRRGLEIGTTYYWRIDSVNAANPDSPWRGHVWKFTTTGTALEPSPADGGVNVSGNVILGWQGSKYAKAHEIYLGASFESVNNATASSPEYKGSQEVDANSYHGGVVEFNKPYYWRIDEVTESRTLKGMVWDFRVGEHATVDDFESYKSYLELKRNWSEDGGAWLKADRIRRHGPGFQSMEINYYNVRGYGYSEAMRSFPVALDMMASGIKMMKVYFRGLETNQVERMYISFEDEGGVRRELVYGGNPSNLQDPSWRPWYIILQDFDDLGVDLTRVKKIGIGFGNRDGESNNKAGYVNFDDIILYPPQCITEYVPEGDINFDCKVNVKDLHILGRDWLDTDRTIPGEPPNEERLLVWYKFDEAEDSNMILADSSGNEHDATVIRSTGPANWDTQCHDGGCLVFHDDTAIEAPTDILSTIDKEITVMVWTYGGTATGRDNTLFDTGGGMFFIRADAPDMDEAVYFQAGSDVTDRLLWANSTPLNWRGYWNHYAFVKNSNTGLMRIYCNGVVVAERMDSFNSLEPVRNAAFDIGAMIAHKNDYIGKMDDFKIYDYALSESEIVGAASGGGDLYIALKSPGDLYDDGRIDFKDFAIAMDNWLREELWPY